MRRLAALFLVSALSLRGYTKVGIVYITDGSQADVQAAITNATD